MSYATWNQSRVLGETILGAHLTNLNSPSKRTAGKPAVDPAKVRLHTSRHLTHAPKITTHTSFLRWVLWMHAAEIQIATAGPQSLDTAWAEVCHFGGGSGEETGSWVDRRRQAAFETFGEMRGHQVAMEALVQLHPSVCFEPIEFLRVYCMLCEMTDSHYNILDALDKMCVFTNSREPRDTFDDELARSDASLKAWNDRIVHLWIEAKIDLKMQSLEDRRKSKSKSKSKSHSKSHSRLN